MRIKNVGAKIGRGLSGSTYLATNKQRFIHTLSAQGATTSARGVSVIPKVLLLAVPLSLWWRCEFQRADIWRHFPLLHGSSISHFSSPILRTIYLGWAARIRIRSRLLSLHCCPRYLAEDQEETVPDLEEKSSSLEI